MLTEIIPLFREQYPGITIEITETSLPAFKKALTEGTLDVGLASEVSTVPYGSLVQVLREEEVFLAISMFHPYALTHPSGTPITAEEVKTNFAGDSLLLSKKGASLRMIGDQFFDSCGFEPVAVCETNNISATRSMVAQNAGVAFISESCSVNRNHIAYYPLSPAMKRLNLVVRQKDWVLNEPEQAFMDQILNYFKQNTEHPYLAEKYSISF